HGTDRRLFVVKATLDPVLVADHGINTEVQRIDSDFSAVFCIRVVEHIAAVACQCQFKQGAGEAGTRLDKREQRARADVEACQCATQHATGFTHEPVVGELFQRSVSFQHFGDIALCTEHPGSDIELVGAQLKNGIVKLAGHLQRPPRSTSGHNGVDIGRNVLGTAHHQVCDTLLAVDLNVNILVRQAVGAVGALNGREFTAVRIGGAIAFCREFSSTLTNPLGKLGRLDYVVDQAPILGALTADTFSQGAENISAIVTHLAFVGYAGQTAGTRQNTQQRYFGK